MTAAGAPTTARHSLKRRPHRGRRILGTALLAVVALIWISPVLLLITTALRSAADFNAFGPLSFPRHWSFSSFSSAWSVGEFSTAFRNSFLITVIKVPLGVVVAALLAYPLAKLNLPFKRTIMFAVLLGITIPNFIAIVPLFSMLRSVGLTDSIWGLIPAYVAFGLPFEVLVLEAFFRRVPDEIVEAGRVDGAGPLRVFVQLVLPLSLPALVTVAILDVVATWNELLVALILLSSPQHRTIPLGLLNFQGQFTTDFTGLSAGVLIAIVPILVLYTALQKWIVSGLTAGAIKG